MMLFSRVFYSCCKDSSSLYALHSSILEPYGTMHIKARIFSGCEYENDGAKCSV